MATPHVDPHGPTACRGDHTDPPNPLVDLAHGVLTGVLAVGAAARVTRLITTDDFPFRPVRDWALTRFGEHGWLTRLLECPWCTGVWVAAPTAASAVLWGRRPWWRRLAGFLALAMVSSAAVVATNGHPTVVVTPASPAGD